MTEAPHRHLSRSEKKIIEHLIRALWAYDPWVLERVAIDKVVFKTERYIAEMPAFFLFTFRVVLFLIQWGLPPIALKLRPFTRLAPGQQTAYLERDWQKSRIPAKRDLFKLVKAACVCTTLTEHRLLVDMGYGPAIESRMGKAT